jgi:hypothetical protein
MFQKYINFVKFSRYKYVLHKWRCTTTNDIPLDVALAKKTRALEKYDSLPPWLAQMIGYLQGVSEDQAWQDLVMEFVQFEKVDLQLG